jgi:ectoine hydroxylase-related dioxygenase (phytanoyl-CoA dioxygenase family)
MEAVMSAGASEGTHTGELTDEQLGAWKRDGFLILERFVDAETLAALRAAYDEILRRDIEASGDRMLGAVTRQVMRPSSAHPTFASNPAVDRGIAIARQVFATADVSRSFDMLIYKPPGHPHDTPWHQDMAYSKQPFAEPGTPSTLESVQFWVPLDDVDAENGCMQFVPGCHDRPLLEHHVVSDDPTDEGRLLALVDPESQLDLSTAVVAAIPAGGATMHFYGTPHYTGPNRSAERRRRAYIFNVATSRAFAR